LASDQLLGEQLVGRVDPVVGVEGGAVDLHVHGGDQQHHRRQHDQQVDRERVRLGRFGRPVVWLTVMSTSSTSSLSMAGPFVRPAPYGGAPPSCSLETGLADIVQSG
jgi:hypothetical protein